MEKQAYFLILVSILCGQFAEKKKKDKYWLENIYDQYTPTMEHR